MSGDSIVLYGCGDVGPIHEPMSAYSELVRPTLAAADLRFAQCERVYSERGALQLHSHGSHSRVKPQMASVFTDCGFDVVSVASNHAMDWGADAMLDTIGVLRDKGIQTIGAGRNLEDARQPAIIERNKVRVAFLAYCSVLNEGYAAAPSTPGVAPLRARTHYEPVDYQAGVPPRVVTVPYEEDLRAMVDDITAAKKSAHIVVLSLHWGVHFVPRVIADYQRIAADAAVNAGEPGSARLSPAADRTRRHQHRHRHFATRSSTTSLGGADGVTALFVNQDDTRAIGDTILILPDSAAATTTLNTTVSSIGTIVTGGSPQPSPVGTGGTVVSGTSPDGSKAVTVLLFTEGSAVVKLEFDSAPGDAMPPQLVTDVGNKQEIAIRTGLPG